MKNIIEAVKDNKEILAIVCWEEELSEKFQVLIFLSYYL